MRHMGTNGVDIKLDRNKLDRLLENKSYAELYRQLCKEWYIDIQYKGFMALLNNKSRWLLIYAYAMAKSLNVEISDLFYPVKIEKNNS